MATLLALIPCGLTFQDLVSTTMTKPSANHACSAEQSDASPSESTRRDQPMRIYLPDGEMRVMRLTEYQEFLQSYSIEDLATEQPQQ